MEVPTHTGQPTAGTLWKSGVAKTYKPVSGELGVRIREENVPGAVPGCLF